VCRVGEESSKMLEWEDVGRCDCWLTRSGEMGNKGALTPGEAGNLNVLSIGELDLDLYYIAMGWLRFSQVRC